jgi:hypothetical protein
MKLGEAISLVRAARTRPGEAKPVVVAGARELVPLLAKELRAGGEASAVREGGSPRGASVYVWVGKADEDALRAASRARVPIVGLTDGESLPYVLDTDIVVPRPGAPMPVEEVASAIAGALGANGIALAKRLPVLRGPLAAELVRREARISAIVAVQRDADEALAMIATGQLALVGRIASLHGDAQIGRVIPVAGLVARRLGHRVAHRLPASRAVRAALAYAVTRAVGEAARLSVRSGS